MGVIHRFAAMCSTYRLDDLLRRCWEKSVEERRRYRKKTLRATPILDYTQPSLPPQLDEATRKQSILFVVHRYWPSIGGTEHFTQQLAEKFAKDGHSVMVLCHCDDIASTFEKEEEGILWREIAHKGVRIVEYRHKRPPKGLFTELLTDDPSMLRFSKALLKREQPDFVHITHLQMGAAMATACNDVGVRYGVTLTDFFCLCHYFTLIDRKGTFCTRHDCDQRCPKWGQSGEKRYEKASILLAEAAFVAAPSHFVAARIHEEYSVQVYVIPHDVELPANFLREEHADVAEVHLLYAGKLTPLKGLQELLPSLAACDDSFLLTICGGGNPFFERKLKRMVRGDRRFRFMGTLSRDELWKEYARTDAVIIPSLCPETYSFTAHEAIAAGCRVIATPMGALPEAVEESGGKMLYAIGSDVDNKYIATIKREGRPLSLSIHKNEVESYKLLYRRK